MSRLNPSALKLDAAGLGVCLAASAIAYLVGVRPSMDNAETTRGALAAVHAVSESNARLESKLRGATRAADLRAERLAQLEVPLRAPRDVNQQVAAVAAVAESCALLVENIAPGAAEEAGGVSKISMRLSGRGAYGDFIRFIGALRDKSPDTAVTAMSLRGTPETPHDTPTFVAELLWHASDQQPAQTSQPSPRAAADSAGQDDLAAKRRSRPSKID